MGIIAGLATTGLAVACGHEEDIFISLTASDFKNVIAADDGIKIESFTINKYNVAVKSIKPDKTGSATGTVELSYKAPYMGPETISGIIIDQTKWNSHKISISGSDIIGAVAKVDGKTISGYTTANQNVIIDSVDVNNPGDYLGTAKLSYKDKYRGPSSVSNVNIDQTLYYIDQLKQNHPSSQDFNYEDDGKGLYTLEKIQQNYINDNDFIYNLPPIFSAFGDEAFNGVTLSQELKMPKSVKTLGDKTFKGTTFNEDFEINEVVSSIGFNTFKSAVFKKDFIVPESVKFIKGYSFRSSKFANNFTLPQSIKSLGEHTFDDSTFSKSFNMSDGVTSIFGYAFDSAKFCGVINISSNLKNIGDDAFADATFLKDLTLPNGLTDLGSNSFKGANFSGNLFLLNTLVSLGNFALSVTNFAANKGIKLEDGFTIIDDDMKDHFKTNIQPYFISTPGLSWYDSQGNQKNNNNFAAGDIYRSN